MEVVKNERYQNTSLELDHRKELLITAIENGEVSLSYSAINSFMESPKSFIDYKLKERKTTPAMIFGTLVHCLILEPHNFEKYFAIKDFRVPSSENQKNFSAMVARGVSADEAYMANYKLNKKDMEIGVTAKASKLLGDLDKYINFLVKEADPKTKQQFITEDQRLDALMYQKLTFGNRAAAYVLEQIQDTELGISWDFSGYKWRGMIDGHGDCFLDLKMMAQSAKPRKARYKITDMGYHCQAALYMDGSGFGEKPYFIIGLDSSYNIGVTELHTSVIDKGREAISNIMINFKICVEERRWDESYDFWEKDDRGIHVMEFYES